jgi:predicted amidohydrolase
MNDVTLEEVLRVGVIQTTVDNVSAWGSGLRMTTAEEERAVSEIQQHLAALNLEDPKPHIILLPEVAVPLGFLPRLRKIAAKMNSVIIAGLDFEPFTTTPIKTARNRAAVIIPNRWGASHSSKTTLRYVGKTYPSYEEAEHFTECGYIFHPVPEIWLFDGGRFGRFGVVICFDLLDLERVAMYRMQVQHLFVLTYNKDATTFDHAAEALARMIYCNVVICNTGHHGGSIAISPYKRPERRMIYRHSGIGLSTSQTICLPVASLHAAQTGNWPADMPREFKALPPGVPAVHTHTVVHAAIPPVDS